MESFWTGFVVGLGAIATVAVAFGVLATVYILAQHNVFFTFVQEGTAKAILRWKRFQRIAMSYRDHELTDAWDIVAAVAAAPTQRRWFGWMAGLYWIGIPFVNSVHSYRFKWTSYEEEKAKSDEKVIDYVLVQDDVYYSFIDEAETKGMVPVNVALLLTLRVVNPYKALFRVQHWLEATQNRIKPAFRSFVALKEFEELTKQKEAVEEELDSFLRGTKVDEFIRDNYGVELVAVEVVRIDPAGEWAKTFTEAATKKWLAEKDKQQIETLADAEVQRLDRVYGKVASYGDTGLFIRAVEAVEQAGKGPSNLVIFPFGALADIVKGWTGKEREEKK